MKYHSWYMNNFKQIKQLNYLSEKEIHEIEVVSHIFPFKANNYLTDELIDWDHYQTDPVFNMVFPQRQMLEDNDYNELDNAICNGNQTLIKRIVSDIRQKLNPHPDGQIQNIPEVNRIKLYGSQHKYPETILFFPSQGQTCHAYCTFCFRWAQFCGHNSFRFAMNEIDNLKTYILQHPQITDILFTGGDPMTMSYDFLALYLDALLDSEMSQIKSIRIGTKSLSYWPYRYLSDRDTDYILRLFDKIVKSGINLSIMAHFNHYQELSTEAVKNAIQRIRNTGAQIRTQSPLLKHINDDSEVWARMWREQVNLNCIPYYMFIARDTGSRHYFEVSLEKAWHIFKNAYNQVSGLCRTVRGPSMSTRFGKIQVLGVAEVQNEKVFVLRFLQSKNPEFVQIPFFAEYNENATWIDDLKPAFGKEKFFFELDHTELKYDESY